MNQIDKNQECLSNEELLNDTVNSLNGLFAGDQVPQIAAIKHFLTDQYGGLKQSLDAQQLEKLDSKIAHILYDKVYKPGRYDDNEISSIEFLLLDMGSNIYKNINAIHALKSPLSQNQIRQMSEDLRFQLQESLAQQNRELSEEERRYWENFMENGIEA